MNEPISEQEAIDAGLIPVEPPEQSEQEQVDQSYVESDCHTWKGTILEEFSIRRQTAASCLGLRWGNLSREEVEAGMEGRRYPGMMQDVQIIIYLCHPRGDVNKQTGISQSINESYLACDPATVSGVRRRMLEWAEKEGIGMETEELATAIELMVKIIKEVQINRFKLPKPEGKAPRGNSPGHLG